MSSDDLTNLWDIYREGFYAEPWYSEYSTPPSQGILLIRHGPRTSPDIPPLSAMLTKEGVQSCIDLGIRIQGCEPMRILSSPVKRCVDTGTHIFASAAWNCEQFDSEVLGHPGPFIIEKHCPHARKLVEQSQRTGDWSFLQRHISGEEEFQGMRDREKGTAYFLHNVISQEPGYSLCISHDSIIAAISASFGLGDYNWPDPLDGISILPKEKSQ